MARENKLDKVIRMIFCGWRPYEGQATGELYLELGCERRAKARWFARGEKLNCIGCDRACELPCPEGFQLPLFTYENVTAPKYTLLPAELLKRKKLLNIRETAYILNIREPLTIDFSQFMKCRQKLRSIQSELFNFLLEIIRIPHSV